MTRDDAITVTQYVINAFPKPDWTDGQTEAFVNGLVPYDAEYATHAVALAHRSIGFRPPLAEFLKFYRAAKADSESRQVKPQEKRSPTNTLPLWVKRWVCARFFYVRYGRPQDMRTFPEQGDYGDPTVPLMPPEEWVKEAEAIGDKEAMAAIQHLA